MPKRRADGTPTEKARATARREIRSPPLEAEIDRRLERQWRRQPDRWAEKGYVEVPDKVVMFYRYSYGQQSRFFQELRTRRRLLGSRCRKCRRVYFPPRAACSECYAATEWREVSPHGVVVSSTTSWYTTSEFFHHVPYAMAYVRPVDADTAMLQRIDLGGREVIEPGTRVVARFRPVRRGTVADFWYEVASEPTATKGGPKAARPPRGRRASR